jgi:hypothetical protein
LLTSNWGNHAETTDVARRNVIWPQQSNRLDYKSISRSLSALITDYSIQKMQNFKFIVLPTMPNEYQVLVHTSIWNKRV